MLLKLVTNSTVLISAWKRLITTFPGTAQRWREVVVFGRGPETRLRQWADEVAAATDVTRVTSGRGRRTARPHQVGRAATGSAHAHAGQAGGRVRRRARRRTPGPAHSAVGAPVDQRVQGKSGDRGPRPGAHPGAGRTGSSAAADHGGPCAPYRRRLRGHSCGDRRPLPDLGLADPRRRRTAAQDSRRTAETGQGR